tara:strand:- start:39 stop:458 length:420 start_codon:yes stop_codon:yes gene_type:complete
MKLTIKELEKLENALEREVKVSFDEAMTFHHYSPSEENTTDLDDYKGKSGLMEDFNKTIKLYQLLVKVLEEKDRLERIKFLDTRDSNYELRSFIREVMVEIPKQIKDEGWVWNEKNKQYELHDKRLDIIHNMNGEIEYL